MTRLEEASRVHDLVLRGEISGVTRAVRDFETRWRRWTGARHVLTTGSGSLALYAAYFGAGVGPGDEVLCPSFTWVNTVGPAILLGARPVLCESDPETLLLDPLDVRRKVTPRTRAIVAVHLWGNVCDLDALVDLARESGAALIEDCSHAHGARWRGRPVGTVGTAGCWSLQGSKPVAAGEAGVLATSDAAVFERACVLGQLSRMGALTTPDHSWLQPLGLGMKLRAHPLGVAIAGVQLDGLDAANRAHRAWVERVEGSLAGLGVLRPVRAVPGAERAGFHGGLPLLHEPSLNGKGTTAALIEALVAAGLPASGSPYPLLHEQPLFQRGYDVFGRGRGPLGEGFRPYRHGDLPGIESAHARLVFLQIPEEPEPGDGEATGEVLRRVVLQQPG